MIVPSRAESFPYIVLEAGAAGRPLITTRVGGIPEIVGDSGVPMIAARRRTALAAAILDVLAAPDCMSAARGRAAQRVLLATSLLQRWPPPCSISTAAAAKHARRSTADGGRSDPADFRPTN